jgi:serine/threonine protein kinase
MVSPPFPPGALLSDCFQIGGELFDFLLKRKRLKETVVQKMFAQLVGAVAYIHQSGCVHRYLR